MKVCTDACLFGAWVVELLTNQHFEKRVRILDIGTGTGLLSLMIAQAIDAEIDAIEIEKAAAKQAAENFSDASFNSAINIIATDIKTWDSDLSYDCIISNPPFFESHLTSPDAKRNMALHSSALSLQELALIVEKRAHTNGIVALILPYDRKEEMMKLALENGMHLFANADIKQTPKHAYFRTFLAFSRNAKTLQYEEIIIQDNRVYTNRFRQLLKKYYLAF
jgi:tRNA1Val (adenine37-N6)-methyltransferase